MSAHSRPAAPALTARQEARRNRILATSTELACGGGFDAVQMREVAELSEVALGTLYRYFPSKVHLLVAVMEDQLRQVRSALRTRPPSATEPSARVADTLLRAFRALQREPLLADAMFRAMISADRSVRAQVDAVSRLTTEIILEAMGRDGEAGEVHEPGGGAAGRLATARGTAAAEGDDPGRPGGDGAATDTRRRTRAGEAAGAADRAKGAGEVEEADEARGAGEAGAPGNARGTGTDARGSAGGADEVGHGRAAHSPADGGARPADDRPAGGRFAAVAPCGTGEAPRVRECAPEVPCAPAGGPEEADRPDDRPAAHLPNARLSAVRVIEHTWYAALVEWISDRASVAEVTEDIRTACGLLDLETAASGTAASPTPASPR